MFTTDANQSSKASARLMMCTDRPTGRNNLEMEISGLQSLEIQMRRDLNNMRSRKRAIEMSGTLKGMVVQYVGVLFTLYCLLRVGLVWLIIGSSTNMADLSGRHRLVSYHGYSVALHLHRQKEQIALRPY